MSKAEKTRAFIIERSAAVFNKKGYAGTSLADLIAVTGLTKGSIYGNFESKDEVALAVYDYNAGRIMDRLRREIGLADNAVDKLYALTGFYRSNYRQTVTAGGCPILNAAVEADDAYPALKRKAAASIKGWRKLIEGIIKKGIEKGEIKKHANAADYAVLFISLIEGGLMMSNVSDDRSLLFTCLDQVDTMIRKKLEP